MNFLSKKVSIFLVFFLFNGGILFAGEIEDKKAVEEMIDRYFSTWSRQDMDGYAACFHSKAVIHFEGRGTIKEDRLSDFIDSQVYAHKVSLDKMTEVPVSKKIQLAGDVAHVIVRWKLTAGTRETLGYDYFTLLRVKKQWKIMYLIFNSE